MPSRIALSASDSSPVKMSTDKLGLPMPIAQVSPGTSAALRSRQRKKSSGIDEPKGNPVKHSASQGGVVRSADELGVDGERRPFGYGGEAILMASGTSDFSARGLRMPNSVPSSSALDPTSVPLMLTPRGNTQPIRNLPRPRPPQNVTPRSPPRQESNPPRPNSPGESEVSAFPSVLGGSGRDSPAVITLATRANFLSFASDDSVDSYSEQMDRQILRTDDHHHLLQHGPGGVCRGTAGLEPLAHEAYRADHGAVQPARENWRSTGLADNVMEVGGTGINRVQARSEANDSPSSSVRSRRIISDEPRRPRTSGCESIVISLPLSII